MKTSPKMQRIIEALAEQHGIDLTRPGAHLKLYNEGYMPLTIENIGGRQVAVGHTFIQEGDLMYDPEIVFCVDPTIFIQWVAIEVTMHPTGYYRRYVEFENGKPVRYNRRGQADLGAFAETWATNLKDQAWLEHSRMNRD